MAWSSRRVDFKREASWSAYYKVPISDLSYCLLSHPSFQYYNLLLPVNTAQSMKLLRLELQRVNKIAKDLSFSSQLHQYQI